MEDMSKILITGTGRSGTSFLVHLLSALGMDTGYTEEECYHICKNEARAGAEHTIEKPYRILKNPQFMLDMEEIVKEYEIDHVIIPIRKAEDVAQSRRNNKGNHGNIGGFTFGAESFDEQMSINSYYFFRMIECLERNEIEYTIISFPLMATDSQYLLDKLDNVFFNTEIDQDDFETVFMRIADIKKITV